MIDFHKQPGETEKMYLWRVGRAIHDGTAGVTWEEATPFINKEWREDETQYRTSSAYRKQVQCAIGYWEEVFSQMGDGAYLEEVRREKEELYKLKKQLSDQRREYNKLLTEEARGEHLLEELRACAKRLNEERPLWISPVTAAMETSEKEVVICFADIHYGMVTDNLWNTYNVEICKRRMNTVVGKMCVQLAVLRPRKIHILLLGDAAHGAIHTSARVASEELVCDQIIHVSELLAQAIHAIAQYSPSTVVYSTYGNHLRTVQEKKDSIHADNMEKMIPWWLKERFRSREDISIVESDRNEFIRLNVCGWNICGTHGDLDDIKQIGLVVNTLFTKKYGEGIDYTISADKHHLALFESYGIENILANSLCGTDDYANDRRLYSNAGQTMLVFTEQEGKLCQYNFKAESREK